MPPNARATAAKVNMLSILAPTTFPKARPGLGGDTRLTAVMLVANSGSEVARATRMLPTNSRPHPVSVASASPYTARRIPKKITAPALPRNTRMATHKLENSIISLTFD